MSFENITRDSNFYQSSSADYGFRIFTGEGTTNSLQGESFRSIQVLTAATLTATSTIGDSIPNTIQLKAGTVILGKFTSIALEEGEIIAYLAS